MPARVCKCDVKITGKTLSTKRQYQYRYPSIYSSADRISGVYYIVTLHYNVRVFSNILYYKLTSSDSSVKDHIVV